MYKMKAPFSGYKLESCDYGKFFSTVSVYICMLKHLMAVYVAAGVS